MFIIRLLKSGSLFILTALILLECSNSVSAQVPQYIASNSFNLVLPSCCYYGYSGYCHRDGFFTTDGKNVYYFPFGFPRSIHRHNIYAGYGPDLRYSTRYRWVCCRHSWPSFCSSAYQLKFQGPYWVHTYHRAARGLFHRSPWQCSWIPYYVAPIPPAPVLGVPPSNQQNKSILSNH